MLYHHHLQTNSTVLITTNIQSRRKIFSNPAYAREAIDSLYRVQELYPFTLYGFVIMPDHCHLLLKVPEGQSLSAVMRVWKGGVAHNIGQGPVWQSRFDAKTARKRDGALQYIHWNPVRAGLVDSPEKYPWSSASGKWDVCDLEAEL